MENYVKNQEFVKKAGISRSTLYRTYKESPELWGETIIKKGKRVIPEKHYKYFDRDLLFRDNKSLRNLLDCLQERDSLPHRLWYSDWSFFVTISYKLNRNKEACANRMRQLYDAIIEEYGSETNFKMFFASEPFVNRKGFHNHLVIHIDNIKFKESIRNMIKNEFKNDKLEFSNYDHRLGAIFYTAKAGLEDTEWDLLGNNLIQEGIKYENKNKH
ncbi:hypothetical protein LB450_08535 [Psychroflexus sp. CAK1W]|uniref:hypothetical protein n=1 Tax=Psychroflexus curvus TaxID=2873595 RepID=UPI001CCDD4D5|nr:hypothetical protein [Psychroflexus curvus]MBZ9628143.1 hypothetical protein [Psychroflexus curvus]